MNNEFVNIPDTEYEANRLGEIRRIQSNYYKSEPVILKSWLNNNGYKMVALSHHSKVTRHTVHRLIAKTFLPDYSDDLAVNHIDGNKQNNHVENLEMVTWSENSKHAVATGLIPPRSQATTDSIRQAHFKPIIISKDGGVVITCKNANDAAEFIGCKVGTIYTSLRKKQKIFGYTVNHKTEV